MDNKKATKLIQTDIDGLCAPLMSENISILNDRTNIKEETLSKEGKGLKRKKVQDTWQYRLSSLDEKCAKKWGGQCTKRKQWLGAPVLIPSNSEDYIEAKSFEDILQHLTYLLKNSPDYIGDERDGWWYEIPIESKPILYKGNVFYFYYNIPSYMHEYTSKMIKDLEDLVNAYSVEVKLFNVQEYLKEYLDILPEASVKECKTKEDCDVLLERLGLRK